MKLGDVGAAIAVGVGATALMDLGAELVRRTRGVPPLDYRLVGRWIGYMPRGRFCHPSIMRAAPIAHEEALGWLAHYAIGTGFACALAAADPDWLRRPTLLPALALGLGSTAAPWLLMQPCFGIGVAASKTPEPTTARLRTVRAHASYGLGLWLAGRTVAGWRLLDQER